MDAKILLILALIWEVKSTHELDFVVFGENNLYHPTVKRSVVPSPPKIRELIVKTTVENRFAETHVLYNVENVDKSPQPYVFSVVFPETALIAGFFMEINGKTYKAFVKEKEEAKTLYAQSVSSGLTAAHVVVSTRNSKRFTINVNVEPKSKVIFHLTYEELLQRERGLYDIITNIQPGQIVKNLEVEIHIKENTPLLYVRTPSLRSGNVLVQNDIDPQVDVQISDTSAIVKFHPDVKQQLEFACAGLGSNKFDGFAGQFVVQYEIERDPQGSETLIQGGYFVKYFAPTNLEPVPKHVVFALDASGSMGERGKMDQLKKAMEDILPQLHPDDLFSVVQYTHVVYLWSLDNRFEVLPRDPQYGNLAAQLQNVPLPDALRATKKNVETMKKVINKMRAYGGSNTLGSLEIALYLIKLVQDKYKDRYQPVLFFVTDGEPNEGVTDTSEIVRLVTSINSKEYKSPIFTVGIGDDVDRNFLQELSLRTGAVSTRIYVDDDATSDVSEQLKAFYERIATPVLNYVSLENLPGSTQLTKTQFPALFDGSEIIVAGKVANVSQPTTSAKGKQSIGERIWAHLTTKQLLEEFHATSSQAAKATLTKLVLDFALNYSLVTEMTSLVAVGPNNNKSVVDLEDAFSGIFLETPSVPAVCDNITNWILMNFGTLEPTAEEAATEILTMIPTAKTTMKRTIATTTTTTTPTTPTTTTQMTTTKRTATTPTTTPTTTWMTTTTPTTTTTQTPTTTTSTTTPTTTKPTIMPTPITTTTTKTATTKTTPTTTTATKIIPTVIYGSPIETEVEVPPSTVAEKPMPTDCSQTTFGCCYDGVSPALAYNYDGCDPIPTSESCTLPQGIGPCNNTYITSKWVYDNKQGQCREFLYSGCGGNGNRFKSKAICERFCVYTEGSDRCVLPIYFPNNCTIGKDTWFYDKKRNQCVTNKYCGNLGNSNRFVTKMDCQRLCIPDMSQRSPQGTTTSTTVTQRTTTTTERIKTCRETIYGCCHDGVSPAMGPNYDGCDPIPTSDICHLKEDRGPCGNYALKWSFNQTLGRCTSFWYGGCEGNANRFDSEEMCTIICIKPSGRGTTSTTVTPKTTTTTERIKTCHETTYGCCHDGVSPAMGHNYDGCDPIPTSESCSLPLDIGTCSNFTNKWMYYNKEGQCVSFIYTGCGGNANRFGSKGICERFCVNPIGSDRCKLPIFTPTNCTLGTDILAWSYDRKRNDCVTNKYCGNLGNSNKFRTKLECRRLCKPKKEQGSPQDACHLKEDRGPCGNYTLKWSFNQTQERCTPFWYGGCKGNGNRFNSEDMCTDICIKPSGRGTTSTTVTPRATTTTERTKTCRETIYGCCRDGVSPAMGHNYDGCDPIPTSDICHLKEDRGPCGNYALKWSFNQTQGRCTQFWYGGCEGNDNRFDSEEACTDICIKTARKDVCNLPMIVGPCHWSQHRWYYNRKQKKCKSFIYGGCNGNSNNFYSLQLCMKTCT